MRINLNNTINTFFNGESRSALIKRNIVGSFFLKGISILISFLVIPITIDFVNPTQYGVWITLSSLMSWFHFFDAGLTLGFRNRFTEAKAKGKYKLAKIYVSTTYASLLILFGVMLLLFYPLNTFIDWSSVLNLNQDYRNELGRVFSIMVLFFSCSIILQVFTTMLTADQRPAISSLISVIGQAIAFIVILVLTRILDKGNLVMLAFVFSGIPVVTVLISSLLLFKTRYAKYRPSVKYVKFAYVRDILGMGSKFFLISTSMLFIFQLINVIISRVLGPEAVTQYNLSYKYFNIAYMAAVLILNPFWSAFTDAYTRGDVIWMKRMLRKLESAWVISLPILVAMFCFSGYFYKLWIDNAVIIPAMVNLTMAVYVSIVMITGVYMNLINGIGKVKLQLYIYILFALISYPIMTVCCRRWGIPGVMIVPAFVYLTQAVIGKIQLSKILSNTANGIWNE